MAFIPRDQVAAAREMDLLTYLRKFEPQELVLKGGNVYSSQIEKAITFSFKSLILESANNPVKGAT